jgi:hypothetical protein
LIGDHPTGGEQLGVGEGRVAKGNIGVMVAVTEGVKSETVLVSPG